MGKGPACPGSNHCTKYEPAGAGCRLSWLFWYNSAASCGALKQSLLLHRWARASGASCSSRSSSQSTVLPACSRHEDTQPLATRHFREMPPSTRTAFSVSSLNKGSQLVTMQTTIADADHVVPPFGLRAAHSRNVKYRQAHTRLPLHNILAMQNHQTPSETKAWGGNEHLWRLVGLHPRFPVHPVLFHSSQTLDWWGKDQQASGFLSFLITFSEWAWTLIPIQVDTQTTVTLPMR